MEALTSYSICAEVEGRGTVELVNGILPVRHLPGLCLAVSRLRDYVPVLSVYIANERVTTIQYGRESVALMGAEN